tara:strand:+ start:161 stop:403 length:243 start_codon:yes stop_codon:yes gene_type:complete
MLSPWTTVPGATAVFLLIDRDLRRRGGGGRREAAARGASRTYRIAPDQILILIRTRRAEAAAQPRPCERGSLLFREPESL